MQSEQTAPFDPVGFLTCSFVLPQESGTGHDARRQVSPSQPSPV